MISENRVDFSIYYRQVVLRDQETRPHGTGSDQSEDWNVSDVFSCPPSSRPSPASGRRGAVTKL